METVFTAVALAAITVAGFMFLLTKIIGWEGIARRKALVDIGCTIAAFFLFAGTSTMGIFVAVISGFIASVTTSIIGGLYAGKHGLTKEELKRNDPLQRHKTAEGRLKTRQALEMVNDIVQEARSGSNRVH